MSLDLSQLETFLAVAELKSFSRAAERLGRTQPGVSQAIRKLEEDIGETLFERAQRDGVLTAAGAVLRDYAERLLALRKEATLALGELRTLDRGRLLLAANEYTCLYLLPVLSRYRQAMPQIEITVQRAFASRIPAELHALSAEIGVLSFAPDPKEFASVAVYRDSMAVIVRPGHPLADKTKVCMTDLGQEDFIAHNVNSPLRQRVVATFEAHRTPLRIAVELPSMEAVKRFVAQSGGVAIVPGLTVAPELESGELVQILIPELQIERELRLVMRRRAKLSYAGAAFLKVVQTCASELGTPHLFEAEEQPEGRIPKTAAVTTRPTRNKKKQSLARTRFDSKLR